MEIVGECIHIISPKVKNAIAKGDKGYIQELALRQAKAGAQALELNIGPQKKAGPEVMEWMVDTVQEVVDLPLSLDTTNVAAMEAGLKRAEKRAIVNSASAAPERLETMPPLAANYNARLIALTMGKNIPPSAEARIEIAMETLMPRILEVGLSMEDVYFDPLILTVCGMQEYVMQGVETVRFLKQIAEPPPKTIVGLSNVSNGAPHEGRSLINCTYLVMLMAAGLDAAIADPLDPRLWQFTRIVEKRDDSTPVGWLLLRLYDAVASMGELSPDDVDMSDPEQVAIYKTVQIIENKVIYADSYLRV